MSKTPLAGRRLLLACALALGAAALAAQAEAQTLSVSPGTGVALTLPFDTVTMRLVPAVDSATRLSWSGPQGIGKDSKITVQAVVTQGDPGAILLDVLAVNPSPGTAVGTVTLSGSGPSLDLIVDIPGRASDTTTIRYTARASSDLPSATTVRYEVVYTILKQGN